ncbi:unnamed protein product [Psylliodes chrysocephalus]|uniref:Hexosyltransferase n=1 Tax=Psylliodes chrysocephalus TaxID=3402493 RepID=A0A9P0GLN0_9CUCU|nr:unnamed protein product [Psylliodes chrysocephala]
MQVILYHNQSGDAAFTGDLKQKEVHRAITLHPVKHPQSMYRLHKYVKGLRIQKNQQESILLHRDVAASMQELGYRVSRLHSADLAPNLPLFPDQRGADGYLGDSSILGVPSGLNRYIPQSLDEVLEWELISKTLYTHRDSNPRKRIGSSLKEGLGDVVREIMELINSYSKQRGRVIDFKEILYGYWRLDPVYGVDLILDLLLVYRKYRGHKMTVQVRRHAYVQQTFTGIFVREIEDYQHHNQNLVNSDSLPVHKKIVNQIFSKINEKLQPLLSYYNPEEAYINFILPLSGRYRIFERFIKIYEEVCLKRHKSTNLYIVLYRDKESPEDFEKTTLLADRLAENYPYYVIKVIAADQTFSRGGALQLGINELQEDSLMLFIDVDMVFDDSMLLRIRHNTVQNKKVYFPIVYSLYNPKFLDGNYSEEMWMDSLHTFSEPFNDTNGFWRQFGFGIVSLYKSDYNRLGGFNLEITGWGNEDVTFYDNAVKSDLKIVRSVDPGLVHIYHSVKCDYDLDADQKNMCLGTKASTLGSLRQLQKLFIKYKDLFR